MSCILELLAVSTSAAERVRVVWVAPKSRSPGLSIRRDSAQRTGGKQQAANMNTDGFGLECVGRCT